MRHWNRGRKTVRNFLLALLCVFLLYASQGFPPYTVRGMCLQTQHDYLLEELEPLYVQRDWRHNAANSYHRDWSGFGPAFGEGAVCVARGGKIYAAGPFTEAASAVAVVRAEKAPEPNGRVLFRDFTLKGERLADQVFAFPYEMDSNRFEDEEPDYRELSLTELVDLWYRRMSRGEGPGTYFLLDGELPCTVTLYGETGEVLSTYNLTVTTEGIRSWW